MLGIAKGSILRLRRICSNDDDFKVKSEEYASYSIACGHDEMHVLEKFREVGNMIREEARKRRKKNLIVVIVFLVLHIIPERPTLKSPEIKIAKFKTILY